MLKERAREVSILVACLDLLLLVVSFVGAYLIRAYVLPLYLPPLEYVPVTPYLWMLLVSLLLFHLLFLSFRVYESIRTMSPAGIVLLAARPFLVAAPILGSLIFLVQDKTYSRPIFVGFLGIYFILILLENL